MRMQTRIMEKVSNQIVNVHTQKITMLQAICALAIVYQIHILSQLRMLRNYFLQSTKRIVLNKLMVLIM